MSGKSTSLPALRQISEINRPLSAPEYYHACVGSSSFTTASPREIVFVLEGEFSGIAIDWQSALDKVVAVNPGTRLRLRGKRRKACWLSDGPPPNIRIIKQCDWDGRSEKGAEFIYSTKLSLEAGPTAELIIAGGGCDAKIIFRVLHAVMDGMGVMHFLRELFRALRDEPLLGANASFSDVDLMLSVPTIPKKLKLAKMPPSLTGKPLGNEVGHTWSRLSIQGQQPNLLARIALAMAEFSRLRSNLPARIAVPVNLRRHCPGLLATTNFSSIIYIDVGEGDTAADVRGRIRESLARSDDADFRPTLDFVRRIPFAWLDRLVSTTKKNYKSPTIMETAMLSNLGSYKHDDLSFSGFDARCLYGIPIEGNVFSIIFELEGRTEITIGMARVLASDGRLESFIEFLENKLEESDLFTC